MAKMMKVDMQIAVDDDFSIGYCPECPLSCHVGDGGFICSLGYGYDECPLIEVM